MTILIDAPRAPQAERPGSPPGMQAQFLGVGTAVPSTCYSQAEILDLMGVCDQRIRSVFEHSAIERRHLATPALTGGRGEVFEAQGALLARHKKEAVEMAADAIRRCLQNCGLTLSDVSYLCCVTSTGLLTPGLSALTIRRLGIDRHCGRSDIVGMGCNAGLNALNIVDSWARSHPGQVAVLVCTEACSAAYVSDGSMRTAVVNSLFGDGAAAIAVCASAPDGHGATGPPAGSAVRPTIVAFSSLLLHEAIDAMRYDWDEDAGKFSFFLDPEIPYLVGANAEHAIDRLLHSRGVRRSDIAHWLIHSGGKKVIDSVMVNLGLSRHDVRHTSAVLRDYGNLSSGSFLFSYQRLCAEDIARPGDLGVLMTMGPGSTIEAALIEWRGAEPMAR